MTAIDSTATIVAEMAEYLTVSPQGARSLPPAAYVDPGFFALERSRIFARAWVCVGRADAFAEPGDYLALSIAGEPLILVRGQDGELRAFSNICRHRLYPLVPDGRGNVRRFTCAYHRWVYALDGRLGGAPHMEGTPGFDRAACSLPAFRVETWLGFVFVNLDAKAATLAPRLAGVEDAFRNHGLDDAVSVGEYRKAWSGNWKLGLENASESYHHMGLHERTIQPGLPTAGTNVREITDDWAYHRTPVRTEVVESYLRFGDFPNQLTAEDRADMKVFTIFPALVLLTVGDTIQALSFIPKEVAEVDVHVWTLIPAASAAIQPDLQAMRVSMNEAVDAVNAEDERGTALVQANASSRFAQRGWLSEKEGVLPGFYAYLARQLLAEQND